VIATSIECEGRDVFMGLRDEVSGLALTLKTNRAGANALAALLAASTVGDGDESSFEVHLRGALGDVHLPSEPRKVPV
jgi:hypothetical protein